MSTSAFAAGANEQISATTSPDSAAFTGAGDVIRVANSGTVPILVTTDGSTPDVSSVGVLAGSVAFLSVPNSASVIVGVITASGTATVFVSRGFLTP